MILTYNDCKNKYGSQYNINKAIKNGELYQLEKGIYSDKSYEPELQIISTKYPNAVFTMNSAFYYHNLTDTIPEKDHLATSKSSAAISDKRVIQRYENSATLELGVIIKEIDSGVSIRIYNKERMLLELIRNKNNIPFDYYKEVLNNYRNILYDLNIQDIQDYTMELPKNKMIMETLRLEVF